jgi:hypothetical protein
MEPTTLQEDEEEYEHVNLNQDNGPEATLYSQFNIPQNLIGIHPLSRSAYYNSNDQLFARKITRYDSTKAIKGASGVQTHTKPVQARFQPNVNLDSVPEYLDAQDQHFALTARQMQDVQDKAASSRRSSSGFRTGRRGSLEDYNSLEDQKFVGRLVSYNSLGPSDFNKFLHDPKTSSAPISPVREVRSPVNRNNAQANDDYFSRIRRVSRRLSQESPNYQNDDFQYENQVAGQYPPNQYNAYREGHGKSYSPAQEASFVNKSKYL